MTFELGEGLSFLSDTEYADKRNVADIMILKKWFLGLIDTKIHPAEADL